MRIPIALIIGTLLVGLPLGLLLAYVRGWLGPKRCKIEHCTGRGSTICVDGLCPAHCFALHGHDCRRMAVGDDNVTPINSKTTNKTTRTA